LMPSSVGLTSMRTSWSSKRSSRMVEVAILIAVAG
jgi:hypothetical protein